MSKPTIATPVIVTGCEDCPWRDPYHCKMTRHTQDNGLKQPWYGEGTPDWCPLRSSPAMVVLRPGGDPR